MQTLLTCSSTWVNRCRWTWTCFVSPCRQGRTIAALCASSSGHAVWGVGLQVGGVGGTELTSYEPRFSLILKWPSLVAWLAIGCPSLARVTVIVTAPL
jgi:hypothetical protein